MSTISKLNPAWLAWPEVQLLIRAFEDEKAELRFVGGSVRDALLGRAVKDVDAATPLTPDDVMQLLSKAHIKALPTGLAHGTVTAVVMSRNIEITTLRKDVATDGRHAEVAYTGNWEEDAKRRDFTMNALYLSPDGELFDYFGGENDAKAGHVAFIGRAEDRIREDYLRILRYFRFFAHYGKTPADNAAIAACAANADGIDSLSGERIRDEMLKLLSAPDPLLALNLMQKHGIAEHVFGDAIHVAALAPVLALEEEPLPLVRLAALLLADRHKLAWLAERWRLSNQEQSRLWKLQQHIPAEAQTAAQKEIIYENGPEIFTQAVLVSAAVAGSVEGYAKMLKLPKQWQAPAFPVGGDDLKAQGVPEGKGMGELLALLEEAWMSSDYTLSRDELLAKIKK